MNPKHGVEQSIIGSAITPVARVLRNRGLDAIEVFEAAGIDLAMTAKPDCRIGIEPYNNLMHLCVQTTDDEAFGLYAAEQLQPQDLHSLGLGWLTSDTVYDGLSRLVRFSKLVSSIAQLSLEVERDFIKLHSWVKPALYLDHFEYAARDYGVGMITRMCQLNLGEYLAPVELKLDRPQPLKPETWESMLATRVSFGCDHSTLIWSRADIEEKLVTGDPALAVILDEQAEKHIASYSDMSTARTVAEKIIRRLPDGPPSQNKIADDLCLSNRTLQRKLKEEGVSFSHILQESRIQLAKSYLRQPNRSVVEVCYLLGFSEPSAFSRAFKRWTGVSPASYRDQQS